MRHCARVYGTPARVTVRGELHDIETALAQQFDQVAGVSAADELALVTTVAQGGCKRQAAHDVPATDRNGGIHAES
jgi:hypothetical protein